MSMYIKLGGGTRLLVSLLIAVLLTLTISPLNAMAADPESGATINYRSNAIDGPGVKHTVFTASGYPDYIGVCCQYGIEAASSGRATATKVSTTSNFAKAVYYFGYTLGWADSIGSSSQYQAYNLSCIIQDVSGSLDEILNNPDNWTAEAIQEARVKKRVSREEMAAHPEWTSVTVPNSLKVYNCEAGDDQNFLLWALSDSVGKLNLKKVSANTAITG